MRNYDILNMRPNLNADSASAIRARIVTTLDGSLGRSSVRKYPLVSSGGSAQRANLEDVMGAIERRLPSSIFAVRYSSDILAP